MLGEDWLDGFADSALLGDGHDLCHLVGQVHLKQVFLVCLEDVQVLWGEGRREGRRGGRGGEGGKGGEGRREGGGEGRGEEGRGGEK